MRTHLVRSGLITTTAILAVGLVGCGSSASDTASDAVSSVTSAAGAATSAAGSAAGSATSAASSAATAEEATITIKDFQFGDPLTVAPGTTVTVVNEDTAPHNANDKGGAFSEPVLQQGESATFVAPSEPGTYDLICTVHPQMAGQFIVAP